MAWVETRITRTSQPQDACGIDGGHSFTKNFVDGRFGDRFESLRNVGYAGASFDNFVSAPDAFGKHLKSSGNGAVGFLMAMPRLTGLATLTWLSVFTISTGEDYSGVRRISGNCYANYGVFRGISLITSSGVLGVIFAGSGTVTQILGTPPEQGKPHVAVVVIQNNGTNSDVSLYQNGVLTAFGTGNYSPHANFELSGSGDDRGIQPINNLRHYLTLFFGGPRTNKEVAGIGGNPWQLYEPEVSRIWVDSAASVTLPTLVSPASTTSAGAWTATGVLGPNTIINGNFTSWTGDNPNSWDVSPVETGTSYVTQVGNAARIVSDGTNVGINQSAATQIGKTYKITITVIACTGQVGIQANNGAIILSITAPGTYSTNVTLTHVGVGFKRQLACDATVSSFECQEVLATSPDLHDAINELVASDTQYISVNSASTTELVLAEAAFPGGSTQAAYYDALSADNASITVIFKQGGTEISRRTHLLTPVNTRYSTVFTPAEIALIVAGPISVLLTSS